MRLPFTESIGATLVTHGEGASLVTLQVGDSHRNAHGAVHGGVLFTLADTGMGAALYSLLAPGETGATIDAHITFLRPVRGSTIECRSHCLRQGRAVAMLEAELTAAGEVVAKASATFAVRVPRAP
ncbi:PaaI family thioesterase [Aquabacterium sp.]|uniref:PaaI family thioesterase n=1 Tax=Aquabacterium sp. TaxID=1872578 RepID=UPI003782F6B4